MIKINHNIVKNQKIYKQDHTTIQTMKETKTIHNSQIDYK